MTHCVVASPFRLASPLGAPLSWPARQPRLLWSARRPSDNARTALDEPLLHGRSPGRASRTTATTTRDTVRHWALYRDSGHSPPAPQAPTGEPQEGPEALSLCCCGCRRILSAYGARRSWPSSHSSARLLHHALRSVACATLIKKQGRLTLVGACSAGPIPGAADGVREVACRRNLAQAPDGDASSRAPAASPAAARRPRRDAKGGVVGQERVQHGEALARRGLKQS